MRHCFSFIFFILFVFASQTSKLILCTSLVFLYLPKLGTRGARYFHTHGWRRRQRELQNSIPMTHFVESSNTLPYRILLCHPTAAHIFAIKLWSQCFPFQGITTFLDISFQISFAIHQFCLSWLSYNWKHTVCPSLCLVSFIYKWFCYVTMLYY